MPTKERLAKAAAKSRLIKAAPELLAALIALSEEEHRDDDHPALIRAREEARKAIAKATQS